MSAAAGPAPVPSPRYVALDAYRGAVMILLVSHGFGLAGLRNHAPWSGLAAQFEHKPWAGLALWDLILPAFFFMVGAALPYSLARRGGGFRPNLAHAAARSLKLLVLAVVVSSAPAGRLQSPVMEVLLHIAFTSFFCFLILQLRFPWQAVSAALILAGHLALFLLFPGPDGPFSMTGNIGAVLDRAILGASHPGRYASLNIVPAIVSTLFGAWAALLLRSALPPARKLVILWTGAAAALACGLALSVFLPVVKRIYTLSYTLLSAGCAVAVFAAFVWFIDVRGRRGWTRPLTVVGVNCLFAYCVMEMLGAWLTRATGAFTGNFVYLGAFAPVARSCAVLAVIWYLCYWLYRRGIVLKL